MSRKELYRVKTVRFVGQSIGRKKPEKAQLKTNNERNKPSYDYEFDCRQVS